MKKLVAILTALTMLAVSAGCSQANTPSSASAAPSSQAPSSQAAPASSSAPAAEAPTIGIIQLTEHPALDQACAGFLAGLEELGMKDGENIKIDFQNAQGEPANCVTIADKMVTSKHDLILAIATPAAQAVVNKTTEIPILVTAVTDPESSKLVASNAAPGGNVSGTSDLNPIKEQIELLVQLVPQAKKVAMLYSSSEANSEFQVGIAKEQLASMNIESVDATISNANEIQQVVQSLKGKVDAIYAPTDNTIAGAMPTVSAIANEIGLPVIVGEPSVVENGGLATYGLSYFNLGKQTAQMANKILNEGANPGDMPIEYLHEVELVINETTASAIGVTIPEELKAKANLVK